MSQNKTNAQTQFTNKLAQETSPYLLQHSHNPVNWFPWGEEALKKAKEEDKPIIVSIGYSSCHWCHVMERESFENKDIAAVMNKSFINIKVDREERPDIDQIYLEALQTMNLRGGWPLNVFLTPDAKPFYGGTYFPPSHWSNLLTQISNAFLNHRSDLENSANEFTKSLNHNETLKYGLSDAEQDFKQEDLVGAFNKLQSQFDRKLGGLNKSPKFPMPSIYRFLLCYFDLTNEEAALKHVKLTLDRMAFGGIYDQLGGGFARYSTDEEWFAPHFEKMLYDNGQLLSLYSEAFVATKNPLYKDVVFETVDWLKREMTNPEGGFYSALDADTEGEEGKFYVWTRDEIKSILHEDSDLFCDYYNLTDTGNWEHGKNILFRNLTDEAFSNKHKIDKDILKSKVKEWKRVLSKEREKRVKPGLDNKILASWNGIMLKGLVDAYRTFNNSEFLTIAEKNAHFLLTKMKDGSKLFHSYKDGKATIEGYLEDYAFVIEGLLGLYQATFNEQWLKEAESLTEYSIKYFYDKEEDLFFFTSEISEKLIARKKELFDNVIPSSNSVMAKNLFTLGILLGKSEYEEKALTMLGKIKKLITAEVGYLSNWAGLYYQQLKPMAEIAIVGENCLKIREELDKNFLPNKVMVGAPNSSNLPLLEDRIAINDKTTIYVCYDKTCRFPVFDTEEALKQIQ